VNGSLLKIDMIYGIMNIMKQIKYLIKLFDIEKDIEDIFLDYNSTDSSSFFIKHKKWLSKNWELEDWCFNDKEARLSDSSLAIEYMVARGFFVAVDWSGEEYPGQIKKFLHQRVKAMGITDLKLNDNELRKSVNEWKIQRGDHIPLLLQLFEKQLSDFGVHIVIADEGVDEYRITLVENSSITLFDGEICENISFELPTLYKLLINEIDSGKRANMMLYLKKKLNLETKQARLIVDELPIEICIDTKSSIIKTENLLRNHGATKTTIEKL